MVRQHVVALTLGVLALSGPALAADITVDGADGASATTTITLSAMVGDLVRLTVSGRGAPDPINAGTVDFGTVTVDGTGVGLTGGKLKLFHSSDLSATFVAELEALVYFTGAPGVEFSISGGAATGAGATGHFKCAAQPAVFDWGGATFNGEPLPPTPVVGSGTCATFPPEQAGSTTLLVDVDLALHLVKTAPSGAKSQAFTFTLAPL